jgi:hypothetical protein
MARILKAYYGFTSQKEVHDFAKEIECRFWSSGTPFTLDSVHDIARCLFEDGAALCINEENDNSATYLGKECFGKWRSSELIFIEIKRYRKMKVIQEIIGD